MLNRRAARRNGAELRPFRRYGQSLQVRYVMMHSFVTQPSRLFSPLCSGGACRSRQASGRGASLLVANGQERRARETLRARGGSLAWRP